MLRSTNSYCRIVLLTQANDVRDQLDWMLGGVQDANYVVVVAMFSWHVYKKGCNCWLCSRSTAKNGSCTLSSRMHACKHTCVNLWLC